MLAHYPRAFAPCYITCAHRTGKNWHLEEQDKEDDYSIESAQMNKHFLVFGVQFPPLKNEIEGNKQVDCRNCIRHASTMESCSDEHDVRYQNVRQTREVEVNQS